MEEIATCLPLALALALLHQRVPPANHITVTIAQLVPGPVIIGPQSLPAIRQRCILATLMGHATQLTAARNAITVQTTSFHCVPPPPSRRLVLAAVVSTTRCFTSSSQSP